MKKKVIVLSLGGSLIIPNEIDSKFINEFKKVILQHTKKYKFIIVCGGGSIARKYIYALKNSGISEKIQSLSGISATRMNARFMSYFFNINPEHGIPHKMRILQKYIKNKDVVFCGALEYKPNQTSDSTAAGIAKVFKTIFINLTDVMGLYDKNPKKYKNAKLIQEISWKDFSKMAHKNKYSPGQHFVLDQTASKTILKNKTPTYIIGKNLSQLSNLLNKKKFKGTSISG
ncbi:UMP kinase [Candidatus Pacearchaeota archaeon]|nr:UMP kinase [Candidatus Pacearchaeota archaeon]